MTKQTFNKKLEDIYKRNYAKKSVIIIGGGPCGILSVKYLSQHDSVNVICFEAKDDLGGMWYLDKYDKLDKDYDTSKNAFIRDFGNIQSSLYESLDLNNPKGLAIYKGFPIPQENQEYMNQEEFYKYLMNYADHYKVKDHTSFCTYVNFVRLVSNMTEEEKNAVSFPLTKKFFIEVVSYENFEKDIRHFQADYVIAASGHHSKPNLQPIPNQELFSGRIMHSHNFRKADEKDFANKHIVIISAMVSSQDIFSILLFKTKQPPKKITVISRSNIDFLKSASSLQKPQEDGKLEFIVDEYNEILSQNTLQLKSGQIIEDVDVILLATGYQYHFPYLDRFNDIDNLFEYYENSRSFGPLYNKIISINEPNLLFPGSINGVNQSAYEKQIIYISQYILGQFELPSKEQMMSSFEEDVEYWGSKKCYLSIARFPGYTVDYERYPRKLLNDLKNIELDTEYQDIWLKCNQAMEKHMRAGNYYEMKKQHPGYVLPEDYAPKPGLF